MRDIALTALVIGLLPLCFIRPWIGILVWSWLGFMNPHKLSWGFARDMPFAMMVGIAVLAGLMIDRDKKAIPATREIFLLLLLLAYFTFTTFFAWEPDHAWHKWDTAMKVIVMAVVSTSLIFSKKRIHALMMVIALSIGFYGVKGGIFTFTTGGAFHVQGPENTFIGGNTELGLAMLMVLPLLVFLAREEQRKWLQKGLYAAAGLTLISIIFTYSRGALVGLAAVLPLLFLKSNKKVLVILVFLPIAYFAKDMIPEQLYSRAETIETYHEDRSSMQRLQAWSVAWNVAIANPLTGGGFDFEYSPDEQRWMSFANRKYDEFGDHSRAAHSIYFQLLGNHGFVAFTIFLLLVLFSLRTLSRIKTVASKDPATHWLGNYASAIQLGIIGYLTAGAFLSLAYFDLFYMYIALTVILHREALILSKAETGATAQRKNRYSMGTFAKPRLQGNTDPAYLAKRSRQSDRA